MTETCVRPPISRSIVFKLVAIMLGMAFILLSLVTLFFVMILSPSVSRSTERLVEEFARAEAGRTIDLREAQRLASELDVAIRYEGPKGGWATSPDLPSIAVAEKAPGPTLIARDYYVISAPDGGKYLFVWTVGRRMRVVHKRLLILLLCLMTGVVFGAYVFQKHLLRPLRSLSTGVTRLSEGELDISVPVQSRDEFGMLTNAFNHMARRVRAMMQARDQLLLDVSHELRSPLTRMKVAVELLSDGESKAGMVADLNEMETMVSELLELERLRDGRRITMSRQDLNLIVRDMADKFRNRVPGVHLALPAETIDVDVDGEKIRVVLRNLLENAMKYSLSDSRAVDLSVVPDSGRVQIVVSDDGIGIPASEHPNLFEPFYRVDRSRSRKTGGYGLGLSICKRIAEAHGGTISVKSNRARGASFVLTLPMHQTTEA